MNIIISAKNLDLTPALNEFIHDKIGSLAKFLTRQGTESIIARVEVAKPSRHHRSGFIYYAEINLDFNNTLLRATAEDIDVRIAIERAKDDIQKQLKKKKEKRIDSHRRQKNN